MGALKWAAIVAGSILVLLLLLPASPGPSRRELTGSEMEAVGLLLGGMAACGTDSSWIANTRIRLRGQDQSLFLAHFEPAYAAGKRLALDASAATCATTVRNGRATIDRTLNP